MAEQWVRRAGAGMPPGMVTAVIPGSPEWHYTGLVVVDIQPGRRQSGSTGEREVIVVPLSGSFTITTPQTQHDLIGRRDVFAGPTDVLYLPPQTAWAIESEAGGRLAVCSAVVNGPTPEITYLAAGEVPVELRGAGQASRLVRNFGVPGVLDANSIIACEVVTPSGNWSSWPPHKHDEDVPGEQANLEEIYYYQFRAAPGAPEHAVPVGYQQVYGTSDRPIQVLAEVRDGDTVLVPHGWHGPAMAPVGYDMYYLNVMAGPGTTRAWLIVDDPAHAWIRESWVGQPVDPRLTSSKSSPTSA